MNWNNINSDAYAPTMQERGQWLVYASDDKKPRAPWQTNSLRLVKWNGELDPEDRPETSFSEARRWATQPNLVGSLGWNDTIDGLNAGYLLPHDTEKYEQQITMVDLDDVRDPTTGEVLDEAADIVERLDSYTEVSQSGAGLHVFVFGFLPVDLGNVIEPLHTDKQVVEDKPKLEIYDKSRIAITTGKHLVDTPNDVNERQDVLDDLIDTYVDTEDRQSIDDMIQEARRRENVEDSNTSPYWDVSPASIVNTSQRGWTRSGGYWNGPHPAHGDDDNNNTTLHDGYWKCFSHDSAGGALQLVGIKEGFLSCGNPDLDKITDKEYAELCMLARDRYGFPQEADPPYRAIKGVASFSTLPFEPEDLSGDAYKSCLALYHNNSWDELANP